MTRRHSPLQQLKEAKQIARDHGLIVLDHFAEAIRRDTKSLCDMGGVDYDAVTKAYRSLS
jgi:hypothetical protein